MLEPPTSGKVLLRTSVGDLDVELWPREAPKAVRNFVQLAMEGYYDGSAFHRIVRGFIAQTGDPTGSGDGNPKPAGVTAGPGHPHNALTHLHTPARAGVIAACPACQQGARAFTADHLRTSSTRACALRGGASLPWRALGPTPTAASSS